MMPRKDNWEKPRTQGMPLTATEIQRLRKAFRDDVHHRDIARELKCSSRTACKYYMIFRGGPMPKSASRYKYPEKKAVPEPKARLKPRFYTSTFELEGS